MSRKVPEWIGATDDTRPPPRVKARILRKHGFRCALTGHEFRDGEEPQYDHIIALINNGENRESNLQPVHRKPHKEKTKRDLAIKAHTEALTKAAFKLKTEPKVKIQSRGFSKSDKPVRDPKPLPARRPMFVGG